MLTQFTDRFISNKDSLLKYLKTKEIDNYDDLVRIAILNSMDPDNQYDFDDPQIDEMHVMRSDDYAGTDAYIFPSVGKKRFYYTLVEYGSCSVCDSLMYANDQEDPDVKATELWTLMLHVVQGLKEMSE